MKSYPEIKRLRWKQLPDAITRRYRFIPVKVEVDEQNIILVCMPQIRRTYGKGGSSKEPAPWKSGICVTDGYQVYHTLEKEKEDLRIAGCWVHCRRKFHEALEVMPKELRKQSVMHLIMNQIQAIYREEGKLSGLSAEERLAQRQLVVKPLVDAFFAYLKQNAERVPKSGKTKEAFTYALNQERYLRVFLEDGDVPMDNNASERAIRGFCIGKKNWEMIDTLHGASSSAIIYSIAETAKANRLKPYEYFEFLLTEIPKHMEDKNTDFLSDLLPWSDALPENIRKLKSQDNK